MDGDPDKKADSEADEGGLIAVAGYIHLRSSYGDVLLL